MKRREFCQLPGVRKQRFVLLVSPVAGTGQLGVSAGLLSRAGQAVDVVAEVALGHGPGSLLLNFELMDWFVALLKG